MFIKQFPKTKYDTKEKLAGGNIRCIHVHRPFLGRALNPTYST